MDQSVSVTIAAKALGVSRVTAYAMIHRGDLLAMGKPKRVFVDDLVRRVEPGRIEAAQAGVRNMRRKRLETDDVCRGLAHDGLNCD